MNGYLKDALIHKNYVTTLRLSGYIINKKNYSPIYSIRSIRLGINVGVIR